ncbi:MAG: YkgJ family cysteine cluster protein [Methanoregulaceae archaeon]|nr:YkgJ family cysteine cluster protein [Methanoregulaceae archaeon]
MGADGIHVPIPFRILALVQERNRLFEYPLERLAGEIREIGFHCDACGKCCIRARKGHVFLLDRDVAAIQSIDPNAIEPAPDPEFCDQTGTFYVSGYTLRTKGDASGACWFLENDRCRIYDRRVSVCRIYPYVLHREPDEAGMVDWQHIAGFGQHGVYNQQITAPECLAIAREIKEYENAILTREISFLEFMQDYFTTHRLRHVEEEYNQRMRRFSRGEPVIVKVYLDGLLEEHTCIQTDPSYSSLS